LFLLLLVVPVHACCMVVAAQHGASAFQPYINHLVGQPSQRRASAHQDPAGPSSGGGSTASSTITLSGKPFSASGILGCLSSQDWAVRRAAADAVRALVLLVGPELEPEDCWGLGDPGSVTGRCLNALEDCRFDKVGTTPCMTASSITRLRNSVREATVMHTHYNLPAWALLARCANSGIGWRVLKQQMQILLPQSVTWMRAK
jgi:hypothetical protein